MAWFGRRHGWAASLAGVALAASSAGAQAQTSSLQVQDFHIDVHALADGASRPLTAHDMHGFASSTLLAAAGIPDALSEQRHAPPDTFVLHTELADAGATSSTTLDGIFGDAAMSVSLGAPDGPWQRAYSNIASTALVTVAAHSAVTISGNAVAAWDAAGGATENRLWLELASPDHVYSWTMAFDDPASGNADQPFTLTAENTSDQAVDIYFTMQGQAAVGFAPFPVPEPGQWAMLLAGVGIVAPVVRRARRARC